MITEKNNVFYCDCGFSWRRGMSGSHNCEDGLRAKLTDMAVQLANAESKCRELAAECSEVKVAAILLADEAAQIYKRWNLTQQPDGDIVDMQTMQEMLCACHETPATDAFLAEVRVQGVEELASLAGNECKRYKSVNDRAGVRKWKSIVILCSDFAAQLRKGAAL